MSGRSTKRVQKGRVPPEKATLEDLEQEAKTFAAKSAKKTTAAKEKPLTPRQHLAGIILAGLLARSQGLVSKADLRREAFEWADYLLESE